MSDVMRRVAMMMRSSTPRVYSTWNAADNGGFTLTGGNLTATAAGAFITIRNTQYKFSGKWYWEYLLGGVSGYWFIGASNSSQGLGTYMYTPNSTGMQSNANSWMGSGVGPTPSAGFVSGDTVGVALDFTAGVMQVYKNNVLVVTLNSLSTGPLTPAFSAYSGTESTVANFGASAFTYAPPSGFNPGWYT